VKTKANALPELRMKAAEFNETMRRVFQSTPKSRGKQARATLRKRRKKATQ